jgi:ribosomal protein L16 Arg81 hydroxylase
MKQVDAAQEDDWIAWIVRNLLRGVSKPELAAVMVGKGFATTQVDELFHRVTNNPIFRGAEPLSWRAGNLEALLDIRRSLLGQLPSNSQVERRSGLSRQEFHEEYYIRNRPVIVTDLVKQWPAFHLWCPAYLREKYGDAIVEIQSNRKTYPVYEVFLKGHTKKVRLAEYIDMVEQGEDTNQYYLTANDRLLDNDAMRTLLSDFWPFPEYFTHDDRADKQFFWFGPRGAVSPLHRDRLNVFMTQVYGRKRVKMVSSDALHLVYNFESFFSEVDAEEPDLGRYPRFADAEIIDVLLEPGEGLLIPVGWWHHVRSLDISISVSLTNFLFPNDFERYYPRASLSSAK